MVSLVTLLNRAVTLAAWAAQTRLVHAVRRGQAAGPRTEFEREGWAQGSLPEAENRALIKAFDAATLRAFVANDSPREYVSGYSGKAKASKVAGTIFLEVGTEQAAALAQALQAMSSGITQALGTPWRVINVRSWRTSAEAVAQGANEWHVDGFPEAFLKIMLYLTPAGPETGTTELISGSGQRVLLSGPAGTWLLFKNGLLKHRGVIPGAPSGRRQVVELTIARALRHGSDVVVAGLDAKYPRFPWTGVANLSVKYR